MKVFYRKKNEVKVNQKKLLIENEREPSHRISFKIRQEESIDNSLKIVLYDNKSGYQYKDNDQISKDSFLEYDCVQNVPQPQVQQPPVQQVRQPEPPAVQQQQVMTPAIQLPQDTSKTNQDNFSNILNENKKQVQAYVKQINSSVYQENAGFSGDYKKQPQQQSYNPMQQYNFKQSTQQLPPGYVCRRCGMGGHFIKDCPTNSNPAYDPYQGKGVPKQQLWKRDLNITAQEFLEDKHKVFRKIVKESYIYEDQLEFKKDYASEYNNSQHDGSNKKQLKYEIPPSLQCALCKGLIKKACLTKCCALQSACQKCIQEALVAGKFQCPFCKQINVYAEDLIPNQQLRLIADWYVRQLLINDKIEEAEVKRGFNQDHQEMLFMVSKMNQTFSQNPPNIDLNDVSGDASASEDIDQTNILQEAARQQQEQAIKQEIAMAEQQKLANTGVNIAAINPANTQAQSNNPLKFNPQLHSGTKYDPSLGRRVPVTDPNELPKISGAGAAAASMIGSMDINQQRMQIQMMQYLQSMQFSRGGMMPNFFMGGVPQAGLMPQQLGQAQVQQKEIKRSRSRSRSKDKKDKSNKSKKKKSKNKH